MIAIRTVRNLSGCLNIGFLYGLLSYNQDGQSNRRRCISQSRAGRRLGIQVNLAQLFLSGSLLLLVIQDLVSYA